MSDNTLYVGIDPGKENTGIVAYYKPEIKLIEWKGNNQEAYQFLLELKANYPQIKVVIELPTDVFYSRNRNGNVGTQVKIAQSAGINRGLAYAMLDFCKVMKIDAKHQDCGKTTKEAKAMYVNSKLMSLGIAPIKDQHKCDAAYLVIQHLV